MTGRSGNRLALRIVLGVLLSAAAWTVVASLVFLLGTGLVGAFRYPFFQWWSYFFLLRSNAMVAQWLSIGAGAGLAVLVLMGGGHPAPPPSARAFAATAVRCRPAALHARRH